MDAAQRTLPRDGHVDLGNRQRMAYCLGERHSGEGLEENAPFVGRLAGGEHPRAFDRQRMDVHGPPTLIQQNGCATLSPWEQPQTP